MLEAAGVCLIWKLLGSCRFSNINAISSSFSHVLDGLGPVAVEIHAPRITGTRAPSTDEGPAAKSIGLYIRILRTRMVSNHLWASSWDPSISDSRWKCRLNDCCVSKIRMEGFSMVRHHLSLILPAFLVRLSQSTTATTLGIRIFAEQTGRK